MNSPRLTSLCVFSTCSSLSIHANPCLIVQVLLVGFNHRLDEVWTSLSQKEEQFVSFELCLRCHHGYDMLATSFS